MGSLTIGSLFSGIGGLELGLEACGLGPVLWQCDSDPYARAVLAEHWPDVRRYNDVREIDGDTARVDLVCGGFPCQPHSLAGKRRGTSDARWLWPEFRRIVEVLRPSAVFIENVPGLRTSGLSVVLADLAAFGFDAEWGCFRAADVGAPHLRRRLFILAYADSKHGWLQSWRRRRASGANDGEDGDMADSDGPRELQQGGAVGDVGGRTAHGGESLANPSCGESRQDSHDLPGDGQRVVPCAASERWPWGLGGGGSTKGQGGDRWATEPDVGRVADGVPARAHRLRLLGNAVVPAQAAHAFKALSSRPTPEERSEPYGITKEDR